MTEEYIQVSTTAKKKEDIEKIAKAIVEKRLLRVSKYSDR